MVDERVMQIADAAVEGQAPTRDDVLYLLRFDGYSVEAAYVCARARQLGARACGHVGLLEGQIGLDALPCTENCRFCSFAAANTGIGQDEPAVVPLDEILAAARALSGQGVHLVSLMATAALPFDQYVQIVAAVHEEIPAHIPILANAPDLDLEQARVLAQAGASMVYHACRLGEGRITDIPIERRHQTMRNVRAAGLALMTGVEPLWMEVARDELADRICELPSFAPFSVGACGLSSVEGSALARLDEVFTPAPMHQIRFVASIVRLVCGLAVPFGGVGAAMWVDAGTDPRSRGQQTNEEWIARDVRRARRTLLREGWTVPDRLPAGWYVVDGACQIPRPFDTDTQSL